ncbi:hypothetical protein V496_02395 [Pseudogymnoascus sp. VKM F-4515 (FW-2607)]|nr:hypothetical protein V496_02395 [Pseudogymnoascus sp. VKM F-4515 (FW-2607)]
MLNLSYHKRSIIELGRKGEDLGSLEEAKEGLDSLQEENESLADKTKMWSERAGELEEAINIILEEKGLFDEAKKAAMAQLETIDKARMGFELEFTQKGLGDARATVARLGREVMQADMTRFKAIAEADNLKTEVSKLKEDMKTQSKDLQAKFTADLIAAGPKLSDKVVEATAILRKEYDVKKTKAKAKHAAALQEARKSIIEESANAIEDLKKELSTEAKET